MGRRPKPVYPSAAGLSFTVQEASSNKSCGGCMFSASPVATCHEACAIAISRGLPDCDSKNMNGKRHIYVLADARQIDIEQYLAQC